MAVAVVAHQAGQEALLLAKLVPVDRLHQTLDLMPVEVRALLPHQLQAVLVVLLQVKQAPMDLVDPPRQTRADQEARVDLADREARVDLVDREARVDLVAAPRPTKAQAAVHPALLRGQAHLHQEPAAHLGPRHPPAPLEGPREQTLHPLEAVALPALREGLLRVGAMEVADHLQVVQREAQVELEARWDLLQALLHAHQMAQRPALQVKMAQALQVAEGQVEMKPPAVLGALGLEELRPASRSEATTILSG